ncbi:hypothetical protein V6N11_014892 [Hibiscus sabdariffa]|uniref:Morc S5 domain-containing protein n=1 Tax=Hibiscus sabdariffa TaxID=183260 RepID=A0ABR2TQZ4_9ROSI
MPPKIEKEHLNVVGISNSDDEGGGQTVATKKASSIRNQPPLPEISRPELPRSSRAITPPILPSNKTLESRSFWKAGNYVAGPSSKHPLLQGSLENARVHPKFLHSNATSHKWAFGAIAELMDNAVDEIQHGATFIKVDKIDVMKDNSPGPALLFLDDGGGMDPALIRKCMSLGYSSKKSNTTIGQYGNGFKTSTMRLGADAIVFSRSNRGSKATQSVGLLSYTFLRRTGQDDVIVPMIDFDISGHWAEPMIYSSHDDWSSNLKTILEWSPFSSKEELLLQFDDIGPHGTKIIIYNLWLNDEGIYELAFDDDDEDIQLRDEALHGATGMRKTTVELQSHISYRIRYSLRAYASMLYLRKFNNFQIILRGKPVQQFNIADELRYPNIVTYKPQVAAGSKECSVETTIGFIKEAPIRVSGFNVYHKNRLIRNLMVSADTSVHLISVSSSLLESYFEDLLPIPFWKVTSDGSIIGNGVVGVLEADFIEPAHDKQDFERSSLFVRLENRLKQMVHDYWKTHCHLVGYQTPGFAAKMKRQLSASQHNRTNLQSESDEPSIIHIPANGELGLRDEQPGVGVPNEVMSVDGLASISDDQLCEENIQLFMRCEEKARKEAELKQTIVELEKGLEDMRQKCARLSSLLEGKRKQCPPLILQLKAIMRKRDLSVLMLSAFAIFFSLQHEGDFSFREAWFHLSDEYPIKYEAERLPPPLVADLNGDGKNEVLVATHDAKIQLLEPHARRVDEGFSEARLLAEVSLLPDKIRVASGRRPVAMATGVIDRTFRNKPQKRVLVVVTSGWSVMCFNHNLKKLWENNLQNDFPLNAHHREIAVSISNYTLKHGDIGLVIVGGRMEMQPHMYIDPFEQIGMAERNAEQHRRSANEKEVGILVLDAMHLMY